MRLTLVRAGAGRAPRGTQAALVALAHRLPPARLRVQVVLGDDVLLKRLNRDFRGRNRPTDVLSFRYEDTPARGTRDADAEIYVSLQRAEIQARERGHGLLQEIVLLVVHGLMHLLGHDHHAPSQARRMRAAEAEQLRWLARRWPRLHMEPLVPAAARRRTEAS